MKYVEAGAGDFYKFFKKYFVAQGTIKLNISWPSNFVEKYFMAQAINFSFFFKACLCYYFRVVLIVIFKSRKELRLSRIFDRVVLIVIFKSQKEIIFTIIFEKQNSKKFFKNLWFFFPCQSSFTTIKSNLFKKIIISSSTVNQVN